MSLLIVLGALAFLMLVAYRGYSVILFAPVAALGAVLLTDPALVAPMFPASSWRRWLGSSKVISRCSCSERFSARSSSFRDFPSRSSPP